MRRKTGVLIAVVMAVAAIIYAAMPLWSGWQLRQAMRARDVAGLEQRVDWKTLRANLKPRVAAAIDDSAKTSGVVGGYLKGLLGGAVVDKGVDMFVTPQTLSRVLAGREFVTTRLKRDPAQLPPTKGGPPAPSVDEEEPDDPMPPRRLKWAFFETPWRFRFEATHPKLPDTQIAAVLALQGLTWRLVDVALLDHR